MASTLQKKIIHGYNTNDNDTISQGGKSCHLGPDTENHHRHMLANISSLIEVENLTDMTIQCSEGLYVYTHKKLLSSVSSLARKLSREHNGLGENQRLHLIINDVSRHTVTHFLKILYTGYTDALKISDFDEIHQLCQVLGVTFNDNSISTSLPDGTIENKTKDHEETNRESTFGGTHISLGLGNPTPSNTLAIPKLQPNGVESTKTDNLEMKRKEQNVDSSGKGKKKFIKEKHKSTVYCICREKERPGMIGCDHCDEWYHTQCLSLSKDEVKRLSNENWSCPNCEFKRVKTKKRPSSDISGSQTGSAVIQAQGSEVSNSASIRTISPNTEKGKTNFKILSSEPSLETLCKATKDIKPQTNRKRRATSDKGCNSNLNGVVNENDVHTSISGDTKPAAIQDYQIEKNNAQKNNIVNKDIEEKSSNKSVLESKETSDSPREPKDNQSSKVNGHDTGTTSQYTLTNKRMSVPQQKKPKKSFEEALFGGCPPSVAMKRHSQNVEKAASIKAPKEHANQPAKEKKLKKEKKSNDTQYYDRKNTVTAQRSDHENSKISSTSPVPIKSNVRDTSKQQKIDENHPCEAKLKIHSTQKKVKQEDTTNQLFFCYNCKSIFISSGALEAHKIKMGHHE